MKPGCIVPMLAAGTLLRHARVWLLVSWCGLESRDAAIANSGQFSGDHQNGYHKITAAQKSRVLRRCSDIGLRPSVWSEAARHRRGHPRVECHTVARLERL